MEFHQLKKIETCRNIKYRWSYKKHLGLNVNDGNHFLFSLCKPDLRSLWEIFHQPWNDPAITVSAVKSFVTAPCFLCSDYTLVIGTHIMKISGRVSQKYLKKKKLASWKAMGNKSIKDCIHMTSRMCAFWCYSPERWTLLWKSMGETDSCFHKNLFWSSQLCLIAYGLWWLQHLKWHHANGTE